MNVVLINEYEGQSQHKLKAQVSTATKILYTYAYS